MSFLKTEWNQELEDIFGDLVVDDLETISITLTEEEAALVKTDLIRSTLLNMGYVEVVVADEEEAF